MDSQLAFQVRLEASLSKVIKSPFVSDLETQQFLIQQGGYVKTPYIGRHGWVSVKSADPDLDKDGLRDLLKEAYYRAAPKRLRPK